MKSPLYSLKDSVVLVFRNYQFIVEVSEFSRCFSRENNDVTSFLKREKCSAESSLVEFLKLHPLGAMGAEILVFCKETSSMTQNQ